MPHIRKRRESALAALYLPSPLSKPGQQEDVNQRLEAIEEGQKRIEEALSMLMSAGGPE